MTDLIERIRHWLASPPRAIRVAWAVAQIVAAVWMSERGIQFYYQGF